MIKRKLVMACLFVLAVQLARVCLLADTKDQQMTLAEEIPDGTEVSVSGTVEWVREKEKITAVCLRKNQVRYAGTILKESKLVVCIRPDQLKEQLNIGDKVIAEGEKESFDAARNPGNFDQKEYYRKQGIHVKVRADTLEKQSEKSLLYDRIKNEMWKWRKKLSGQLQTKMGSYYGGTMSAILMGEKSGLDEEMRKLYQKNGMGHLLAISGLHMSLIGMGLYSFLRKAGTSFFTAGMAGSSFLLLYTGMTGNGIASQRAWIMFAMRMGAEITGREYDALTGLAAAAVWICLRQPLYLTDAGFLLSFGAILGIILIEPVYAGEKAEKEKKEREKKPVFLKGLSASFAVNTVLMGPVLWFYYEIPVYSVILNLVVIPLLPVAMGAGLLGLGILRFSERAGGGCLNLSKAILWIYDRIGELAARLPVSRWVTGKPPLYLLVLYYGLILLICIWFYRLKERRTEKEQRKTKSRERWVGVPGILLVCLSVLLPGSCWLMHQVQGQVTVTVLDVGQGDGICIRMPGGKNCLIDGGSSDVSSVGAYRIEPYLLYCGIRNIDYAFVSHGDEDHISGIRELLQDQKLGIGIRTLVLPAEKYWDEKLKELAVLAAENGTRIAEIHAGEQVVDGTGEQKMSLRCIGPEMVLSESGNAASMVLQAEYGNFSMLLTGDVEGAGEKQLVKSGRLGKCRILKAAHHGSKNSGTEEFLDAVEPQIVLISAGRGNRYGHPHEETLERLKSRNCQVYSTQQCGAVTIQSDGKKLFFSRKCGGGGSD